MRMRLGAGLLSLVLAAAGSAFAAEYPAKPVRVLVGFTPGSGVDIMARAVGQKFSESTGQPFVIENKPGGGSNIAVGMGAGAEPDGYTITVITVANAINATLYPKLPFDALRDFTPIILAGTAANFLVVNPAVKANTVQELIALAKAQPGKLTFGSSGSGTSPHLAGELFKHRAGIDVVHVPYRGGPQATTDLIGGQINYLFAITSSVLPHVQSGKLRALAVTSRQRTPLLPQLPTMIEAGVPDFEAVTWFGFAVPAGTPSDIVKRLNAEIGKALAAPDVKEQLGRQGIDAAGGTPEQFSAYMRDEFTKWGQVVKESGARAE